MKTNIITKEIMNQVYEKDSCLYWKESRGGCRKDDLAGGIGTAGYYQIQIDKKRYMNHRILFQFYNNVTLESEQEIDHINHIQTDNRKENLRMCTRSENNMNKQTQKNNKLGIKNISKYTNKAGNEYYVLQIKFNKKLFVEHYRIDKYTQEEVIEIRNKKLLELHGNFCCF